MLYVQNDDPVYVWWLEANDPGFVANLRTGGRTRAMLPRTRCSHLYPPDAGKSHTRRLATTSLTHICTQSRQLKVYPGQRPRGRTPRGRC
jgi:hypothetical protein